MQLPVVKMIFPIWTTLWLFYNMLLVILSGHDQIKLSDCKYMFRLQIPCLGIS